MRQRITFVAGSNPAITCIAKENYHRRAISKPSHLLKKKICNKSIDSCCVFRTVTSSPLNQAPVALHLRTYGY